MNACQSCKASVSKEDEFCGKCGAVVATSLKQKKKLSQESLGGTAFSCLVGFFALGRSYGHIKDAGYMTPPMEIAFGAGMILTVIGLLYTGIYALYTLVQKLNARSPKR